MEEELTIMHLAVIEHLPRRIKNGAVLCVGIVEQYRQIPALT